MTGARQLRVASPSDLASRVGETLGTSSWVAVDQHAVDLFAEVTGDRQWIHLDPVRAADGPFGTTIAHGFLTLSLCSRFIAETLAVGQPGLTINYGLNRVRFPAPVPVGSRLRATTVLSSFEALDRAVQVVISVTVNVESDPKPVCVAEMVVRFVEQG